MLLSVIIKSVPFEPNMSDIKKAAEITDDRTLKEYLAKLDDAGLVKLLMQNSLSLKNFDKIIEQNKQPGDIVFVDVHSEATSEKRAMGFWCDGRAALVCGTHTHVATADLQILPKGTGFVSDTGMTGAKNSVLGVPIQNSLDLFMTGKFVFEVEEQNPIMLNAIYAEVENGLATKVERIYKEINL